MGKRSSTFFNWRTARARSVIQVGRQRHPAVWRDWRRHQRHALGTDPLAADLTPNGQHAGRVFQLLGHVLPDTLERAATTAGGVLGLVVDQKQKPATNYRWWRDSEPDANRARPDGLAMSDIRSANCHDSTLA